jgi:CRP-like cAMP-binding protein
MSSRKNEGRNDTGCSLVRSLPASGSEALFTDDDLELLARLLRRRDFREGGILFRQGTEAEGVWILQSGWVVLSPSPKRRGSALAIFGERQCVGDIPLLLDAPAPQTSRA